MYVEEWLRDREEQTRNYYAQKVTDSHAEYSSPLLKLVRESNLRDNNERYHHLAS